MGCFHKFSIVLGLFVGLAAAPQFAWAKLNTDNLNKHVKALDTAITNWQIDNTVQRAGLCSDSTFMRRVYLDTIGRIPTAKEAQDFLSSKKKNKRQLLIAHLLDSPGYVHHQFNWWSDLLRLSRDRQGGQEMAYADWLRKAIAKNMAYDDFVKALITASGRVEQNGAVGYYLRDGAVVLDTIATTAQVFLGTQMFCAQCHNHPFEDTKQKEYYEMAAFMAEVEPKRPYGQFRKKEGKLRSAGLSQRETDLILRYLGERSTMVSDNKKRKLTLPADYQYTDAKPGSAVTPRFIMGDGGGGDTGRYALAKWLTSPKNPNFTRVMVNRLWKRYSGYGFFEPIDDLTEDTEFVAEPIFKQFCDIFVELDYDIKALSYVMLSTQAYQMEAGGEVVDFYDYKLNARALRRMQAEQVWDSLLTVAIGNPDEYSPPRAAPPRVNQLNYAMDKRVDVKRLRQLMSQVYPYAFKYEGEYDITNGKPSPLGNRYYRSAQLPRGNELMYAFGQSSRQTVVNEGDLEPSIQQTLKLLNGDLVQRIIDDNGQFYETFKDLKGTKSKLGFLYLSLYGRYPNKEEVRIVASALSKGRKGFQDVVWVMINSHEFKFIQ